ncbi:MAG: T9SS type A sorting domain-containing protein, partial [Polaribacter sp.]
GVTFYRNSNPSINLIASSSNLVKSTKIDYISGKTKGLDPRFDIGMFNGVSSELSLYTHLLEENSGIAFSKQVLPNQDFESMIIPVGVKVASGKEITFSANANNLPNGINVYLEDRQENTFTRLDEVNSEYKITLSENLDGVGRFYLHAKSSVLSKDNVLLESVNVFAPNNATLRILGLPNGNTNVKMFNVLGKQVLNNSFSAVTSKDISLPRLAKGVYIVQLQTENGSLNKKIILE